MSETKHTPGPWANDPDRGSAHGAAPVIVAASCWRGDRREVAKVLYHAGSEDPEVLANARLIAAAPDLLAACVALCNQEDWGDLGASPGSPIGRGRAAISKALGGDK